MLDITVPVQMSSVEMVRVVMEATYYVRSFPLTPTRRLMLIQHHS